MHGDGDDDDDYDESDDVDDYDENDDEDDLWSPVMHARQFHLGNGAS